MSYVLSGRLRTHSCGGEVVPVANATLMIYRKVDAEPAGFSIRDHEQIRDREYALMCQGRTNEAGEFRIDFSEKTIFGHRGSTHPYAGEEVVIDAYVRSNDGNPLSHEPEPVQFTLGDVAPAWQQSGDGHAAQWEHVIGDSDWQKVRESLDAWAVVGRVVTTDRQPLAGYKVSAYDADLVKDDYLGSATTDADGRFRIDYAGEAFRQTPVRGADFERGGPELYFHVESPDGAMALKEDKSRGNKPDRADATTCFTVELVVGGS